MPLMPHIPDVEPIARKRLAIPTHRCRSVRPRIESYKLLYVINSTGNAIWLRQSVSSSLVSSAKPGLPGWHINSTGPRTLGPRSCLEDANNWKNQVKFVKCRVTLAPDTTRSVAFHMRFFIRNAAEGETSGR